MYRHAKNTQGFTLIELLVVIAIIGMLSSVVLASLQTARQKSRDARRISDLRQLQLVVESYANDHGGRFPSTSGVWRGGAPGCYGGHGYDATGYIPDVVPEYIAALPEDPIPRDGPPASCYLYRSNGTDYMILVHLGIESFDPDDGPHPLDRPCCNQQTIGVYTSGAQGW